jgi:beta-lactamase regulating signal transducer with metallopeptidase domain
MSLTGGALTVLLLLVKPLIRDRMPMSAQYYLWFVVVAALLIPVSKLMTLPVAVVPPISKTVDQYVITAEEAFIDSLQIPTVDDPEKLALRPDGNPVKVQQPTFATTSVSLFMLFYPICTAFVLLCYLVSYWWYLLKLSHNRTLTDITAPVRVYKSEVAATPMLIGVFRPVIVLPLCEYTDEQLRNVLTHELTHLRRRDILVKWLSVIAVSLHWFNPFAWLMRREIDRLCELSCDEAVISRYGVDEKQSYGDTLIAVVAEHKSPKSVLSTTMVESKQALKERLGAIMKHKKSTTIAIIISVLLIIAAIITVVALGAGRTENEEMFFPTVTETTAPPYDPDFVFRTMFEVTPSPQEYRPFMSSTPGILLLTRGQANGTPKVQYSCESGSFGLWEDNKVETLGDYIERDFGSSPYVLWTPSQNTKDGERIFIRLVGDNGVADNGDLVSVTLIVRIENSFIFTLYSLEQELAAVTESKPETPIYDGTETYSRVVSAIYEPIDIAQSATDEHIIPIIDGKRYLDLEQAGKLVISADDIANYQFRTNSEQIVFSIPEVIPGGQIIMYNAETAESIAYADLSKKRIVAFTNLTSSKNYYIEAIGIDAAVLITVRDK